MLLFKQFILAKILTPLGILFPHLPEIFFSCFGYISIIVDFSNYNPDTSFSWIPEITQLIALLYSPN